MDTLDKANRKTIVGYLLANLAHKSALIMLTRIATESGDLLATSTNAFQLGQNLEKLTVSAELVAFLEKVLTLFNAEQLAPLLSDSPVLLILLQHVKPDAVDLDHVIKLIFANGAIIELVESKVKI